MKKTAFSKFAIDNASILFLSLIRRDHTNTYRFTMTLREEVCPETLQKAVDRVYRRFPTVIAGFHPGFFHYSQVPAQEAPQVQEDPGCLLTMGKEELCTCAYRVLYKDRTISIEAFHALTDGYGAIASFTTLVAEYLRLKHGVQIPVSGTLLEVGQSPLPSELADSFLDYAQGDPMHLPSRYSYTLPGGIAPRDTIRTRDYTFPTQQVLDGSRRKGVSITALVSGVLAASIMEVQEKHPARRPRPVRIMVPMDLRRMFPSKTLRNFVLYALPTLEVEEAKKPVSQIVRSFAEQIKAQLTRERMTAIMTYNVHMQRAWYFRVIPLTLKCALMRLIYRFFGDSNSTVTVTNLGNVILPPEMAAFVEHIGVILTPRMRSPYNCSVISYNNQLSINISRFPEGSDLEDIFGRKLHALLREEEVL